MITKAIVQSVNTSGTRCVVRMPLFETSSNSAPVEADALVCITPGVYNNLVVGDIVFVSFEENAMEKPVILGKLFRGTDIESAIRGGGGIFNTLKVTSDAALPATVLFTFPTNIQKAYTDLNTPKKIADYIKWIEQFTRSNIIKLDDNFRCFKNWTQWQLKAENVEIDDGDLDNGSDLSEPYQYQEEGEDCKICGAACLKNSKRSYTKLTSDKIYPNT